MAVVTEAMAVVTAAMVVATAAMAEATEAAAMAATEAMATTAALAAMQMLAAMWPPIPEPFTLPSGKLEQRELYICSHHRKLESHLCPKETQESTDLHFRR